MLTEISFCGLRLAPLAVDAKASLSERLDERHQGDLIRDLMYWQDAGFSPLPLVLGQKHPGAGWPERTSPTVDQFSDMVRAHRTQGIGVPLRENDVVIDIEGRARPLLPLVVEAASQLGVLPLLERVVNGLTEETPSLGLHTHVTLLDGQQSKKQVLARRPKAGDPSKPEVLVEALGLGQQVVVAPSGGMTHSTRRAYRRLCGDPSTIAAVTEVELEKILSVFRRLDEMPFVQPSFTKSRRRPETAIERDFNERKTWEEILGPHGWRKWGSVRGIPGVQHWVRPGKSDGTSATTCRGKLCVFSTSTNLPQFQLPRETGTKGEGSLTKFDSWVILQHDGDRDAALRAAFREGFGKVRDSLPFQPKTEVSDAVAFLAECLDSAINTGPKSKAEICDIALTVTPPQVLLRVINRERRATGKLVLRSLGDASVKYVLWAGESVSRRAIQRLIFNGNAEFSTKSWVLKRKES